MIKEITTHFLPTFMPEEPILLVFKIYEEKRERKKIILNKEEKETIE